MGRCRHVWRRDELLKMGLVKSSNIGLIKEKTQEVFSVGLSVGVYVRRRIFE